MSQPATNDTSPVAIDHLITAVWLLILAAVVVMLAIDSSRDVFAELTRSHPYLLGVVKIALLGSMGELLGHKIVSGRWRLTGIRLAQRVGVWVFWGWRSPQSSPSSPMAPTACSQRGCSLVRGWTC